MAIGYSPSDLTLLGEGHFGSAWRTPKGTVVKITSDPSEIALVNLGKSHASDGLPRIAFGPMETRQGIFAYEREDLPNLSFWQGDLSALTVVKKPETPMTWEKRLAAYDRLIYAPENFQKFPMVIDALRRLRRHNVAVWDLKHKNLGLRGRDVVIRDGRCIMF